MSEKAKCQYCEKPVVAKGLCKSHYYKRRRKEAELPCGGCGHCPRCMGRRGGLKGGRTRAEKLGQKALSTSAKRAVRAKLDPAFRSAIYEDRLKDSRSAKLRRKARVAKRALEKAKKEGEA